MKELKAKGACHCGAIQYLVCGEVMINDLHGKPDAWLNKDTRKGVLSATVCGQCGKVELSVDNPQELWEIYKRHEDA